MSPLSFGLIKFEAKERGQGENKAYIYHLAL